MPETLEDFMLVQAPTAERPLLGLTVLVVEDSLFASEAMRLLCLRSGARIRRADSLHSAHRHLSVYRPVVVIVDLGLPDGSGASLISELAQAAPRIPVILGISGDPGAEKDALDAGADGFLAKPVINLSQFQEAVLSHLPADRQPRGPRTLCNEEISPDPLALHDDFTHLAELLGARSGAADTAPYIAQFLGSLARLARDEPLQRAAGRLGERLAGGGPITQEMARISGLLHERLTANKGILGGNGH